MKKTLSLLLIMSLSLPSIARHGCKPNYSGKDKITHQQVDVWSSLLYMPSTARTLVTGSTSGIYIYASIGKYGDDTSYGYRMLITVTKSESTITGATLESSIQSVKGSRFILGMKDSKPLSFIIDDASQTKKIDRISGLLMTTVVLVTYLNYKDLPKLRDILTREPIDAMSIPLANGAALQPTIKTKRGEKMMDKFNCYFNFIAKERNDN